RPCSAMCRSGSPPVRGRNSSARCWRKSRRWPQDPRVRPSIPKSITRKRRGKEIHMTAIEIVILLVAGLALALHFLPKQTNPLIAKAQSDVDGVWDFLLNHFSKAAVTATPVVPVSVAPVPVSVTAPIPAVDPRV